MATISTFQQDKLKNSLPAFRENEAYKNIPVAVGKVTMDAASKDVTIAGVVAEDIVIASIESDDTTGAGVITATAAAGKITVTSTEVTTGDGVVNYAVYKA
jgi:hypothetical protein